MKIIGREKEIESLRKLVGSDKSEFLAVYGRRRVGKTFLIRQTLSKMFAFSTTGILEGTPNEQRESFGAALLEYGADNAKFSTWIEAFGMLRNLLEKKGKDKPLVVFIDELSCFDTQRSGFVRALGYFWNNWAAWEGNIKLIVCGSATSWMTKNVLNGKGGLHNRVTDTMNLKQFTLRETETYLQEAGFKWTRQSIAQCYMILGGIPYYLGLLNKNLSLPQNIDMLFFASDSKLKDEYKRLYCSLFKHPEYYMKVIELLSSNKSGLTRNEISNKLVGSNGQLSMVLNDLQQCGFIGYFNVRGRNGGVKSSDGLYRLSDFYTIFYFDFCKSKTSDEQFWSHQISTPKINTWFGFAYERLCMAHVPQIKSALGISGIHTEFYSWRSKNSTPSAQIDLLIERSDGMINLCEIKYSSGDYLLDSKEFEKILNRQNTFVNETNCKQGVFLTLVTVSGAKNNEYSQQINNFVTINDLFR
ncbi:MAG: ATP-binding protein [Bacteroidia bacterium]|nr:ATP-binding protein [Bacteroidia bacterium]